MNQIVGHSLAQLHAGQEAGQIPTHHPECQQTAHNGNETPAYQGQRYAERGQLQQEDDRRTPNLQLEDDQTRGEQYLRQGKRAAPSLRQPFIERYVERSAQQRGERAAERPSTAPALPWLSRAVQKRILSLALGEKVSRRMHGLEKLR